MSISRKAQLWAVVVIASIAVVITSAATALGARTSSRPFQITKVTPQNYVIFLNGHAQTFTIHWTGDGTFPINAYIIPAETCSNGGFTCGSYSHHFAHGTKTLVWHNATSCNGGLSSPFVGHEYLYLVSSKRHYTDAIPLKFTCKP